MLNDIEYFIVIAFKDVSIVSRMNAISHILEQSSQHYFCCFQMNQAFSLLPWKSMVLS